MLRTETIMLAGEEYVIEELPLRKNAEWRARVAVEYEAFAELLGETQTLELDKKDASRVIDLLRRGGEMVFHSPETIVDLVFAYAPGLAAQRGDILERAYESELMEAFAACLRLAFPFGRLTRLLSSLAASGSTPAVTEPTSSNSDEPSTEMQSG